MTQAQEVYESEQSEALSKGVGWGAEGGVYMQIASGYGLPLGSLDLSNVTVEDLALQLSRQPRYNGGFKREVSWYGGTQHSVLVCDLLPSELKRQGLLHDLHEAIAPGGDVIRPHKIVHPELSVIENPYAVAVRRKFGLPDVLHPKVKQADLLAAAIEKRDVMARPIGFEWGDLPEPPEDIRITPLSPEASCDLFLQRFYELEVHHESTIL